MSTQTPVQTVSRHVHEPDWQSGAGCVHPGWFCQEPVSSQFCGVEPEQRDVLGAQAPVQSPSPLHANGQVWVVCQEPVASHVCFDAPEHCVCPGTHLPVQAPRVHPNGQVCELCHTPLELQVCTPSPAHCFAPVAQARRVASAPSGGVGAVDASSGAASSSVSSST